MSLQTLNIDVHQYNQLGFQGEVLTHINGILAPKILDQFFPLNELSLLIVTLQINNGTYPIPFVATTGDLYISEALQQKFGDNIQVAINPVTEVYLNDMRYLQNLVTLGTEYYNLGSQRRFKQFRMHNWIYQDLAGTNTPIINYLTTLNQVTSFARDQRIAKMEMLAKQNEQMQQPTEEIIEEESTPQFFEESIPVPDYTQPTEELEQEEDQTSEDLEQEEKPTPETTNTSTVNSLSWSKGFSTTEEPEETLLPTEEKETKLEESESPMEDVEELQPPITTHGKDSYFEGLEGTVQLNNWTHEEYKESLTTKFIKTPVYKTNAPYEKTNILGRDLAIRKPEDQTVMRFKGTAFTSEEDVEDVFKTLENFDFNLTLMPLDAKNKLLSLWLYMCYPVIPPNYQQIIDLDIPFSVFTDYYRTTPNQFASIFLTQYIAVQETNILGLYEGLYWRQILRLYTKVIFNKDKYTLEETLQQTAYNIETELINNVIKKVSDDIKFNFEFDNLVDIDSDTSDDEDGSAEDQVKFDLTEEELTLLQKKGTFSTSIQFFLKDIIQTIKTANNIETLLDVFKFMQISSIDAVTDPTTGNIKIIPGYFPVSFYTQDALGLPNDLHLHVNEFGILLISNKQLELPVCAELCAYCRENGISLLNIYKKQYNIEGEIDTETAKQLMINHHYYYNIALDKYRNDEILEKYIEDYHKPILSLKPLVLKPLQYIVLKTNSREFIQRLVQATANAKANVTLDTPTFILCSIENEEGKENMKSKMMNYVLMPVQSASLVAMAGNITFVENNEMKVNYTLCEKVTFNDNGVQKAKLVYYPFTKETLLNNPNKTFTVVLDKPTMNNFVSIRRLRNIIHPNIPRTAKSIDEHSKEFGLLCSSIATPKINQEVIVQTIDSISNQSHTPEEATAKLVEYKISLVKELSKYINTVSINYDEIARKNSTGKPSLFNNVLNTIKEDKTLFSNPSIAPIDYLEAIKGNVKDLVDIEKMVLKQMLVLRYKKLSKAIKN